MRLNRGQFLGVDVAGLSASAFVVRVTRYVPGARLEMHDHRSPNLCLIVSGGFEDLAVGWGRARVGAAVMHPGGMGHAQEFAGCGSLAVNVEMDRTWLMDVGGSDAAGLMRVTAEEALTAARRVRLALGAREPERCIAATLARLVCGRGVDGVRSENAAARAIARCDAGRRVRAVAAEVGLDASHLGREFARRVGCSPSKMAKWERVALAVELLRETELGLAAVAMRAGYCDQSHMCSEVKKVLGVTPRQMRGMREGWGGDEFGVAQEMSKT